MTISKEERQEWRKKHSQETFNFGHRIIRLLDALESTERERDALAERLVFLEDYPPKGEISVNAWLEWARQQARGNNHADNPRS